MVDLEGGGVKPSKVVIGKVRARNDTTVVVSCISGLFNRRTHEQMIKSVQKGRSVENLDVREYVDHWASRRDKT